MNLIQKLQYYLNKAGIFSSNIPDLKEKGLITDKAIVKFLIRQEYLELKQKYNYYLAQEELAQKYSLSVKTIQNYLYTP